MLRTLLGFWLAVALVTVGVLAAEALPEKAEIAYTKGILAFDEGRYAEALGHFQAGLQVAPDDPHLNLYAGISLNALGREAEAVVPLRRALERDPTLRGAPYHLGVALFRTEQFAEALAAFRAAQHEEPDRAVLYYYEGLALQKLGRLEESIAPLEKAADLDPEFRSRARFYSGVALYELNRPDEARVAFQDTLELGPPGEVRPTIRRFLTAIEEGRRPPRRFRLTLYAGFDYDDNVIAEPNGFTDRTTAAGRLLTGPPVNPRIEDGRAALNAAMEFRQPLGDRLTAGLRYRAYGGIHGNLSSFNVNAHRPAAYLEADLPPFRLRGEYEYTYAFLGSDASLQVHSFGPSVVIPFGRAALTRVAFRFRDKLFFENRLRDSDEYLLGTDTYLFPFGQTSYVRLGYALSENRAVGREYDSEANIFSGGFLLPLPWKLTWAADAYVELRDYEEDFFGLGVRDDTILTVPVRLMKHLDEHWAVVLSYTGVKADSNIGDLDYDENIYSFGLQFSY